MRKMRAFGPPQWWIWAAFAANVALAGVILAARGAGVHGTETALAATARLAFLWFWAAYAGGALANLFGPAFLPLKQHGREFGLAFAAALLVHLSLVSWLCFIGAAPARGVFVFFGTAAAFAFLLAILSFRDLHKLLGPTGWRLLRIVAMNFILYAFLSDFMRNPLEGGTKGLAEYLPFTAMAILAPLLRLGAWSIRFPALHRIRPGTERLSRRQASRREQTPSTACWSVYNGPG
jgi:hypothetical protein